MVPLTKKSTTKNAQASRVDELTIVIPAYDEECGIEEGILQTHKANPDARILVVNDGSSDRTPEILSRLKSQPYISVITHATNKGYGAALKTGFRNVKTPFFGFLDADLTYDPGMFPKLLKRIKENNLDCAWSNRLAGKRNEMPMLRKIGNRTLVITFWLVTGTNIKDCTSGQRVFRTEALTRLDFETLPDGLDFISSLSKRIVSRKLKFSTIPSNYSLREGDSKLNVVKDFIRMMRNIFLEK